MVGSPQQRPRIPKPGSLFAGRYQLGRKLAAGGMGAVFEAHDQRRDRAVALKMLHPELCLDREMHRRFRRESSVLEALDHPSVVRVLGSGSDERGLLYTVMELLEGETLHARIHRPPRLRVDELARITEGICGGLDAAHEHGVLHGDLKPANVFLLDAPASGTRVKLVDFGTSKIHGLERLTRTGEIIGTPVYMAPELLTGTGEVDERIDIYALGVLLYEALAGQPPFMERNPGRLMYQIVAGDAPPLREARPEVSEGVAAVVARAMAPKAADRYRSARALAQDLRAAVA